MPPVPMGQRGWYVNATLELRSEQGLVLEISGASARALRRHLPQMIPYNREFGVWNAFNMVRFRRFHRLFFSAIGLGLGVSMEPAERDGLVVRMNRTIGYDPVSPDAFIVRKAQGASASAL
jgi:hypothetical protein